MTSIMVKIIGNNDSTNNAYNYYKQYLLYISYGCNCQ